MTSKSDRLRPVARATEKNERSAAILVTESKRALDEGMLQLEQLDIYRNEYIEMFRVIGGQGLSAQKMQEHRIFIANLESAIAQQRQLVEKYQKDYDVNKKIWYASRGKVKALDTVIVRHEKKEQQEDARRDQRELDDRPRHVNSLDEKE